MADPGIVDSLSARWAEVGTEAQVVLEAIELWMVDLPFRLPVRTAKGSHQGRPVVLVRIIGTAGPSRRRVEGWGECAALADTTFDHEDTERAVSVLRDRLVPALFERIGDARILPRPVDLGLRSPAPEAPLAFAALEMAVADAHLRAASRSFADLLGVESREVTLGVVIGQEASIDTLVAAIGGVVEEGYARVKLKIGPGWDTVPLDGVRRVFPGLPLQVDANGSYRTTDQDHLATLDQYGLLCIEQPFDRDDGLTAPAALAARMATPICLDESIDSPERLDEALAVGACSVVCVKPARLGGIGAALRVIDRCVASGTPMWMGGMFESGYGRGVITTLAALDGFSWPGDLSPSRSYLADDLVPSPAPGRPGPEGFITAELPTGMGMGPPPDTAGLEGLGAQRLVLQGLVR
jgi:O-succinylbenzoate synthase